jgi:hypothetical protein
LSTLRSTIRGHAHALGTDFLVLAALVAGAVGLGILVHGRNAVAHEAIAVLAFAAGVAAAILLAAVAGLTGSARTGRIAGAVALYAGVALLVRAAGLEDPMNIWVLASCAAALGALGMLVLGVRGPVTGRAGRWAAGVVGGLTVTSLAAIVGVAVAMPGTMPPAWSVATLDVVAWSGAGAAGMVALVAGTRSGRALVRRTGIAFSTLSAAHAVRIVAGGEPGADRGTIGAALELAAVGMLLVAAVAFFVAVLRGLRSPQVPLPRPATALRPTTDRAGTRRSTAASLVSSVTIGPVTDGIRILTPAGTPLAGQAPDSAASSGRPAGHPRRWSSGPGSRRNPGRTRPPGRHGP